MESHYCIVIALITGFLLDQLIGDPGFIPHPVVGFGKFISWFEKRFNKGWLRFLKGLLISVMLVATVYFSFYFFLNFVVNEFVVLKMIFVAVFVFYALSAKTLRREVQMVFVALERSTAEGRTQLSRIVGRDVSKLEPQQIRKAALETLSENLSDGVVAPLFWFAVLGLPGILAYKMVNTLDSMIGYKTERYLHFGRFAARLDDVANFIPARLTALIMLVVSGSLSKMDFVFKYGKCHSSPNSGYPEAALAGILNCRFGGPNIYFGKLVDKPFIGFNERELAHRDLKKALRINQRSEILMVTIVGVVICFLG